MMGQGVEIRAKLQSEILRLQHFCTTQNTALDMELGPMKRAFPNHTFPLGATHEFLVDQIENVTASSAFILALLHTLMRNNGTVLWASAARTLFPPALETLGVRADRFLFLDVKNHKDVLWVMDEALKCGALTAVVGDVRELTFNESRKLQLAVEQSRVTGFILRHSKKITPTASVSRWKITSLPSETIDDLPGIGFPKWKVELLRIRNGQPGAWELQWINNRFVAMDQKEVVIPSYEHYEQEQAG
jgi:protein ImuA